MNVKNLNIAMLSIHSCPIGELGTKDTGGMSVYIMGLAKELGNMGNRVDIFTRRHEQQHAPVMALTDRVRLIHLAIESDDDFSKLAVYPRVDDYANALIQFSTDEQKTYDLIHSHYWLSGLVGSQLRTEWNIPHVIMFHTLGAVKNNTDVGYREPGCRISSEKTLVHSSQKIVAPTEKEKNDTIRYYDADPESISVIPCGVDQALFKPVDGKHARRKLGYGNDEKMILYVGRVEPLKGIERIIGALAQLKERMAVKLLIVGGDDPHHSEMQSVARVVQRLGLEDQVVFAGRVDQQKLPYYYSAADALVVASFYESFGLVALEALSCGTPVVSTPVGGMGSVIRNGETGILVENNSAATLAEAVFTVLSHTQYYREKTVAIRNSVSGFSWPMVAKKMRGIYHSVLD